MERSGSQNNLVVSRKVISIVSAFLVLMGTFIFISGYFWGYRRAAENVDKHIQQTGITDQLNHSIEKNFGTRSMPADGEKLEVPAEGGKNPNKATSDVVIKGQEYYAELIGFGRLKAAQSFVDKAKKKGYPVYLRQRVGKTGGGKVIHWYQAITEKFKDKEKLNQLLEAIKRTERIHGIKIKTS